MLRFSQYNPCEIKTIIVILFIALPLKLFTQINESYKIYTLLINETFQEEIEKIIIEKNTNVNVLNPVEELQYEVYANNIFAGLSRETFDSFIKNNKVTDTIFNNFNFEKKVIILNKTELQEAFKNGWNSFYSKFEKSQGILTLSKVGFNPYFTQALLYYGNSYGIMNGEGYFVFFMKVNGNWKIINKFMVWIS